MRWLNIFFALALLVLLAVSALFIYPAYNHYSEVKLNVAEVEKAITAQRQERLALRTEIDTLRTDNRAIERAAREYFDLCREGETIYQFAVPASRAESSRVLTPPPR